MRTVSRKMIRTLLSSLLCGISFPVWASALNNATPLTDFSTDIYQLHRTLFWVCLGIGLILSLLLIHSMLKYRKSINTRPNNYQENNLVELFWLSIPCFLLIALAVPATLLLMHFDTKAQNAAHSAEVSDYFLK